jgi:hypothetical protein
VEDANTYRAGHPLAQRLLERARSIATPDFEVAFDYSGSRKQISILEPLRGRTGWLICSCFTVSGLEMEDHLILTGFTADGDLLDEAQCRRLFDLSGAQGEQLDVPGDIQERLGQLLERRQSGLIEEMMRRDARWFDTETEKLDHWADDRRTSLKVELDELDAEIRETRRAARLASNLPEKLEKQQALRKLETRREEAWRNYDSASRELEKQKDSLLDEISKRLQQSSSNEVLFMLRWNLI